MNTDETNPNSSDHSTGRTGQPQPQTRPTTREKITTQARRCAPILYTAFRII